MHTRLLIWSDPSLASPNHIRTLSAVCASQGNQIISPKLTHWELLYVFLSNISKSTRTQGSGTSVFMSILHVRECAWYCMPLGTIEHVNQSYDLTFTILWLTLLSLRLHPCPFLPPFPCALPLLQMGVLTCAMATGSAPWDRTAGIVSARQAGEEMGAVSPWKPPAQTTKTMKEVRQQQTSQNV